MSGGIYSTNKVMSENKEIIEAEVQPEQALAIRQEQHLAAPGLFGTTEPKDIIAKAAEVATALKEVVVKQGLVSNISGKQYPRCEAWTLLGTMLGVFPVLVWTKPVEGGWEARVEARTKDGSTVGAAEAECLRSEKNWSNRDDFALRSMAQTRATAKCLRMPLGFVMTLSGFEATPAEEMAYGEPQASRPSPHTTQPIKAPPAKPGAQPAPTQKVPPSVAKLRAKFIENLTNGGILERAIQYLIDLAWLMPNEPISKLEDRFVPTTKEQYTEFLVKLTNWSVTGKAEKPYEPGDKFGVTEEKSDHGKVILPPEQVEKVMRDRDDEWWREIIVPIPRKGQKRDEYLKNPDSIESLYEARHDDEDARKRLWGFVQHYEPKAREFKGKTYQPTAADHKFREALDAFYDYFEKNHPEEKL